MSYLKSAISKSPSMKPKVRTRAPYTIDLNQVDDSDSDSDYERLTLDDKGKRPMGETRDDKGKRSLNETRKLPEESSSKDVGDDNESKCPFVMIKGKNKGKECWKPVSKGNTVCVKHIPCPHDNFTASCTKCRALRAKKCTYDNNGKPCGGHISIGYVACKEHVDCKHGRTISECPTCSTTCTFPAQRGKKATCGAPVMVGSTNRCWQHEECEHNILKSNVCVECGNKEPCTYPVERSGKEGDCGKPVMVGSTDRCCMHEECEHNILRSKVCVECGNMKPCTYPVERKKSVDDL